MYSPVLWVVLNGISIALLLLLMMFLVMNCLRCDRLPITTADDAQCLQYAYAQLEQTQDLELEMAVLQGHPDMPICHEDSASLKLTIDQQICPQFNMLNIDDLQEVLKKVHHRHSAWDEG